MAFSCKMKEEAIEGSLEAGQPSSPLRTLPAVLVGQHRTT